MLAVPDATRLAAISNMNGPLSILSRFSSLLDDTRTRTMTVDHDSRSRQETMRHKRRVEADTVGNCNGHAVARHLHMSRVGLLRAAFVAVVALLNVGAVDATEEAAVCARAARDNNLKIVSVDSMTNPAGTNPAGTNPAGTNPASSLSVEAFITSLTAARVVVIGEQHDQWAHHLAQLEIICQLARNDHRVAIGFEQFKRPTQPALDRFSNATIGITGLLDESHYFSDWGYDFRLYAPILTFAATRKLPLVALNASNAVVDQVRDRGIGGLEASTRAKLQLSSKPVEASYEDRLRRVFDQHSPRTTKSTDKRLAAEDREAVFSRFVAVQRTWEAVMATTAVDWLNENSRATMVILAGSGHVVWSHALPDQLRQRGIGPVLSVDVVLADEQTAPWTGNADFRVAVQADSLKPTGRLGVALDTTDHGVVVGGFGDVSAAKLAGIVVGDRIVAIGGDAVTNYDDVRRLLWRAEAGDVVSVTVDRDGSPTEYRVALR